MQPWKLRNAISYPLSGGNVSMRAGENLFLVTPSGMIYEEMTADDVVVIDRDCRVVEGRESRPRILRPWSICLNICPILMH